MFSLRGSLDGIGFAPIRQLLASTAQTGCLYVWLGPRTARVYFVAGQIVGAALDAEDEERADVQVRTAHIREFVFAEREVSADSLEANSTLRVMQYLDTLGPEPVVNSPTWPILAAVPYYKLPDDQVDPSATLEVELTTLRMLAAVDGQRSIAQLSDHHDLAQTLRDLARLVDLGFIGLQMPALAAPSRAPIVRPVLESQPSGRAEPSSAPRFRTAPPPVAAQRKVRCPMLGFVDDPDQASEGPSLLHRCFASGMPAQVTSDEQRERCFSGQFAMCPRLRAPASLPAAAASASAREEASSRGRPRGLRAFFAALGLVDANPA